MKNIVKIAIVLLMISGSVFGQKYITKNGKITFFSDAPSEKIEGHNNQVNTAMDISTGDLVFKVLMKSFEFENALMQEHFNDQYAESTKFPRADFKGNMVNLKDVNFTKDGSYKVSVKGDLTMHGVTKNITVNGIVEIKGGKPVVRGSFTINLKDYKIDASSVTEKVDVEVSCQYQ